MHHVAPATAILRLLRLGYLHGTGSASAPLAPVRRRERLIRIRRQKRVDAVVDQQSSGLRMEIEVPPVSHPAGTRDLGLAEVSHAPDGCVPRLRPNLTTS